MTSTRTRLLVAASAAAAASLFSSSSSSFLGVHATTYMLPMTDGVQLHTDVDEPPFESKKVPAVIERSPYGQDEEELIALVLAEALGYVGIRQDVRGTGNSQGEFACWHDSANDSYTTMDWIVQQPWSNGQVFTTGVSADAIDEYATISRPHPAVRGTLNVFATTTGWETFYIGGAYRQALIDGWLHKTVPDAYPSARALVRSQEQPGNPWWDVVNGSMWYQNVDFPSLHWAGHYDIFQQGNLAAYHGFQHFAALKGQAKLVIDPLGHCQDGASFFTHDTIFGRVLLPFLMALDMMSDHDPTNKTFPSPPEGVGNVTIYVMGAEEDGAPGQYWTSIPDYPDYTMTNYYLTSSGGLSTTAPTASSSSTTYIYNPADPVPTIGGNNLMIPCGPLDQRPIEDAGRQDVLLFTSDVLQSAVAVSGGLTMTLYVSTNVTDTDMVAKLIDVYPADSTDKKLANTSTLVADGIARMKWRLFPATNLPELLSGNPNDVYEVTISLWNTTYIFAPGHKIRVHVTSSNYPRFEPNYNNGLPINASTPGPNMTAQTTVYFTSRYPSALVLPIVDASTQLPPFPVEETVKSMIARREPLWRALNQRLLDAGVELKPERQLSFLDWATLRLENVWKGIANRYPKNSL